MTRLETSSVLSVTVHDTLDSFSQLREPWNELLRESYTNTVFLTFEWLYAWWESTSGGRTLYVLAVWDGYRLVAAAPFCIKRQALGVRAIQFIGDGDADLSDVLVRRGYEQALNVLLDLLRSSGDRWDCLDLKFVPHDMLLARCLVASPSALKVRFQPWMSSPYMVVDRDWRSRITSKFNKRLRYCRRGLEKAYGPISLEIARKPDEVVAALEVFCGLHQLRWVDMKKSTSNYAIPTERERLSRLFLSLAEQELALVVTLKCSNRPVAIAANMLYDGRMYYSKPAFDPEFSEFSPSKLLIAELLDYCCEHDIKVFDLLRGDEEYKLQWTSDRIDLYHLCACQPKIMAELAMSWYTRWRDRTRSAPFLGEGIRRARWYLRRLRDRSKAGNVRRLPPMPWKGR